MAAIKQYTRAGGEVLTATFLDSGRDVIFYHNDDPASTERLTKTEFDLKIKNEGWSEAFTTVVKRFGNGAHIIVDKRLVNKTVRVRMDVLDD